MSYAVACCLLATALFLAFLLSLALHPQMIKRITGWAMLFSAVTGLLLYGLGYGTAATTPGEMLVAALQAGNGTLWLFGGRESFAAIKSSAPWFAGSPPLQIMYWLAYLSAVYVTASAVLNALGQRILRTLRQRLLPLYKLCLFYGEPEETLALARELPGGKGSLRPLFIWNGGEDRAAEADSLGGIIWKESRLDEEGRWLKSLGLSKGNGRTLEIVCLHGDDGKARWFLNTVTDGARRQGLGAAQLHLAAVGVWDTPVVDDTSLADGEDLPVDLYTRGELAARRLIAAAPPWQMMTFDDKARAEGDFTALIVGFGSVGQSALRVLIQNAQFAGSRFSAVVVDKTASAGAFRSLYADMLARYQVTFHEIDADSPAFVELLQRVAPSLRYAVVCTGGEKRNREIMGQLRRLHGQWRERFPERWTLARMNGSVVTIQRGEDEERLPAMTLEELLSGRLDNQARAVNASYLRKTAEKLYPGDRTAQRRYYQDAWYRTDRISRLSSRASASYYPAMLGAAGLDPSSQDAPALLRKKLDDPALLEVLSRTEHLRWVAFQSTMGVHPMDREEFRKRVERCLKEIGKPLRELEALTGEKPSEETARKAAALAKQVRTASSKVRKDLPPDAMGGIHVCLADWEELEDRWALYEPLDHQLNRAVWLEECVRRKAAGEPGTPGLPESHNFQQLDTDMVWNLLELGEVQA